MQRQQKEKEAAMRTRRGVTPRGGFTLLELLMVVIIIAILASIALPQYLRVSERSRASEALTILAAVRSSELRYKAFSPTQVYTTVLGELDVDMPAVVATSMWAYSVTAAAAGANGMAKRNASAYAGATIEINLDDGVSCSSNAVYGLTVVAC